MKFKPFVVFAFALCAMTTQVAHANDGGIAWGGSPKLLSNHPSVAMQSEVITMNVGKEKTTVDCRFVFKNYGRATTVRMGFPDEGSGDLNRAEEVDINVPDWRKTKPLSTFSSFKSWVNGVPVQTKLVRSDEIAKSWHTKAVRFPTSSTRRVRDLYTVPVGGQIATHGFHSQTSYVLHTGASWRGAIGRSEVIVNFINTGGARRLKAVALRSLNVQNPEYVDWDKMPRGTVVYQGPSAPTVRRRTLRFVRTNWNPTENDDIFLYFNPRDNKGRAQGK